jgi:hypothetical protein
MSDITIIVVFVYSSFVTGAGILRSNMFVLMGHRRHRCSPQASARRRLTEDGCWTDEVPLDESTTLQKALALYGSSLLLLKEYKCTAVVSILC